MPSALAVRGLMASSSSTGTCAGRSAGLAQTPEMAALYSSLALIACTFARQYRGKRMRLDDIYRAMIETGRASLDLLMIAAAAGFIIGVLNVTGLSFALTIALVHLGAGNAAIMLLLAAAIAIVLGMGMPTVGVYVLLAALVAPALTEVGIPPLAAHLFVLYFGMMSMTTPPVAVAAYAAASIIQADFMRTGLAGVRFGWSAYIVPFLFVWSPTLLMQGSALDVTLAFLTAAAGIYLVSVGVVGYMIRPVGPLRRVVFALAGLALMIPARAFEGGIWTDVGGAVVGAALVAWELGAMRRAREAVRKAT